MKLPEQLPTDPDEIERLYQEYAQDVEDFDDAEFQRIMDARLAVWGIDPQQDDGRSDLWRDVGIDEQYADESLCRQGRSARR